MQSGGKQITVLKKESTTASGPRFLPWEEPHPSTCLPLCPPPSPPRCPQLQPRTRLSPQRPHPSSLAVPRLSLHTSCWNSLRLLEHCFSGMEVCSPATRRPEVPGSRRLFGDPARPAGGAVRGAPAGKSGGRREGAALLCSPANSTLSPSPLPSRSFLQTSGFPLRPSAGAALPTSGVSANAAGCEAAAGRGWRDRRAQTVGRPRHRPRQRAPSRVTGRRRRPEPPCAPEPGVGSGEPLFPESPAKRPGLG